MIGNVEVAAILLKRGDGWRFAIRLPDGREVSCEEAYETKEAALAAFDRFCTRTGAAVMKVQ